MVMAKFLDTSKLRYHMAYNYVLVSIKGIYYIIRIREVSIVLTWNVLGVVELERCKVMNALPCIPRNRIDKCRAGCADNPHKCWSRLWQAGVEAARSGTQPVHC